MSPAALVLLRRILGGDLAVGAGRGRRPPAGRGGRAGHRGDGGPPRPPHPLGAVDRRPLSPFGVYVHVPFCRERCDYCAFATYTDRDHLMERYADACVLELRARRRGGRPRAATSVFFGGGTPSRLHPDTLCRILTPSRARPTPRSPSSAIPRTPTTAHLGAYRAAGRHPRLLRPAVDPRPRPGRPRAAPRAAAPPRRSPPRWPTAGFATWNLDLIFGAASRERRRLGRHARRTSSRSSTRRRTSAPTRLTVEPGTPLARDPAPPSRRGRRRPRRYELADAVLARGRATPGRRSPTGPAPATSAGTTTSTGSRATTSGIGSAAHSHRDGVRWWNVRTPERYVDAVEAGRSPERRARC